MLINQTIEENNRRILRTNTNLSSIKKSKKQRENLSNDNISHQRKLRSSKTISKDTKSHRQKLISITKKERKKRIKKILNHSEQEIIITQSIEPKPKPNNSNK